MSLSRRVFISTAGVAGAAAALAGPASASGADTRPTAAAPQPRTDPFTLGVASGDPLPDGFVIWTRLAPEPLAPDGLGGMPSRRYDVRWEVATDRRIRDVVRRGTATTGPSSAHAVHVEIEGLRPGREYWYRFRLGPYASRVGRTLTAPAPRALPPSLAMAFVSCSQYEHGYFTAYRRLAEERPDLVLHLGDYQYEYTKNTYVSPTGNVRDHEGPETVTLANYRQRHPQYRSDQACGDGYDACPDASDPSRTITGADQEEWLLEGFRRSTARWDVLGQQVFFAQRDRDAGPLTVTSMDAWDGYVASRDRISSGWVDAGVRNPVVLTGDVHAHWASDLKTDYADPGSATIGSELVCSSITSGGNGFDSVVSQHPWAAWNPHLRFWSNLRGYVSTTITPTEMKADFRCVPQVTVPGQPAYTRASFVIEDRRPGLQKVLDQPLPASSAAETVSATQARAAGRDTVRRELDEPRR